MGDYSSRKEGKGHIVLAFSFTLRVFTFTHDV